jgi:ABC-type Mn2+/Zn2+ transport system ATPase subunit
MAPLSIHHLNVFYGQTPALADICWEVPQGLTAIIGPNGAGKSTLLKAALGLIPSQGEVRFFGTTLNAARARIGYLPQRASVDWDFPASALDVVAMARTPRTRWWGALPRREREAARAALAEVGMEALAERPNGQLSGGQQQRVAIARAIALEPRVMLFDEPTSALDPELVGGVLQAMRELRESGMTMVVVSHEMGFARAAADRVVFMADGQVVEQGPPAAVFGNPQHERTRAFIGQIERH